MVVEENWGVSLQRFRRFFQEQPDASETAEGLFCGGCRIVLIPCEGHIGPWRTERTRLRIEGAEADVSNVRHRVFLRFLSAGG